MENKEPELSIEERLKSVEAKAKMRLICSIVFWSITIFLMVVLVSMHFERKNIICDEESLVLTFVGILATFVVVSNYIELKMIDSRVNDSLRRAGALGKEADAKIKQVEGKADTKIKEVEEKADAKVKEVEEKAEAKIKEVEEKADFKIKDVEENLELRMNILKSEVYVDMSITTAKMFEETGAYYESLSWFFSALDRSVMHTKYSFSSSKEDEVLMVMNSLIAKREADLDDLSANIAKNYLEKMKNTTPPYSFPFVDQCYENIVKFLERRLVVVDGK